MVSAKSVEKQCKKLKFNIHGWGRAEIGELQHILIPDEDILEAVNGVYEGGFALLVATTIRVLLVDKKPLNYLTVEDLRFDMINEIDYSHRLMGARISISTGSKNLKFNSYNQQRLRKLINHVQHAMADKKSQENEHQVDQKQHLEQINQQLQTYLLAQHQHQQKLQEALDHSHDNSSQQAGASEQLVANSLAPEAPKLSHELSDYLLAQQLLDQHKQATADAANRNDKPAAAKPVVLEATVDGEDKAAFPPTLPVALPDNQAAALPTQTAGNPVSSQMEELYAEGVQEIFGRARSTPEHNTTPVVQASVKTVQTGSSDDRDAIAASSSASADLNPLKIAYSKLPMALRNRKFGRPSFHSHSQTVIKPVIDQA